MKSYSEFLKTSMDESTDADKLKMIKTQMQGYVGSDFVKKASDDDILAMIELKDKRAEMFNKYIRPIAEKETKLRQKYRLRAL